MKALDDLKELLEDQLKKITKKDDISTQELENAYKAVDIIKDIETICAMKQATEEYESDNNYRNGNSRNNYSNRMPMYMYDDGSYLYMNSNRNNSNMNSNHMPEIYMDSMMNGSDMNSMNSNMGNSNGSYDGSSYRRGRDPRTGRYISRMNYSRDEQKERMIEKLEDMMEEVQSEKDRRAIEKCIEKLEREM